MENASADWMDLQAIVNTEVLMKSKNITTESLLYGLKIQRIVIHLILRTFKL